MIKNIVDKIFNSKWSILVEGIILGALLIIVIRMVRYKPADIVHYHANFAVYINGKQEQFANPIYYTEIEESCTASVQMTPHERAHMHDNVNSVVHIEDSAVTWGQFFQNLGWIVEPSVIRTADKLYLPQAENKITFILDGETTDNIVRRVIKDQDRLLVNYGPTSLDVLQTEYKTVPASAHKYDITQDPKSCSGHKKTTFRDRLVHTF